jgi:hypothetical protein
MHKTFNINPNTGTMAGQIVLLETIDTRFGRLFWNPEKAGLALVAALLVGTAGLFGGAFLGVHLGSFLLASLFGIGCSVLGAVVGFAKTLFS